MSRVILSAEIVYDSCCCQMVIFYAFVCLDGIQVQVPDVPGRRSSTRLRKDTSGTHAYTF